MKINKIIYKEFKIFLKEEFKLLTLFKINHKM